jgi:peptide/nickel transport system substrate-binding protein
VVFTFKEFFAEWDYRFGWGYYSASCPRKWPTRRGNWKNHNGTGPFMLTDFVQGNSNTYTKNPIYWDKETIGGEPYKLPFADKLVYRIIKDEAPSTRRCAPASSTCSRRALERGRRAEEERAQLKWNRWLNMSGTFLAMRVDTKPFDDIRVRRALNMAVNKQEIVKAYYGGNAELFAYPHASRLPRLLSSRSSDARVGQGAVHLQPGQGEEAAGRGRVSERLQLQGAGLLVQRPTTWTCCRWWPPTSRRWA